MFRPRNADSQRPSFVGLQAASQASSKAKKANRARDTQHEILLRSELWRLGLRYRKNVAGLPGKPDIVFGRARVIVFCDGDFWHGRNWRRLEKELSRRHNSGYWREKIRQNIVRDRVTTRTLERQGWRVVRLWERDVIKDPALAATKVHREVKRRLRSLAARNQGRIGAR
jgi:DNA mismatch endonuclease (patch repair protein)